MGDTRADYDYNKNRTGTTTVLYPVRKPGIIKGWVRVKRRDTNGNNGVLALYPPARPTFEV